MKILHIGYFSLTPKPPGYLGTATKISNGLVANGHYVLNFSDRDVARGLSPINSRKSGAKRANRYLLDVIKSFCPDLILLGHADVISNETLAQIRLQHPTIRVAQWNVDPLFDGNNVKRLRDRSPHVDGTFCTTDGPLLTNLIGPNAVVRFIPNPSDYRIERFKNFEKVRSALTYDLFYAAGNPNLERHYAGIYERTGDVADSIKQCIPNLRCSFPGCDSNPVTGNEYETLLSKSAMGLNINRRNENYLYSSDRIAHLMGNGILTFIDRATGYSDIFSDTEVAFFSSKDELHDLIDVFRTNDDRRKGYAKNGWKKYHRLFDAKYVAKYIVDVTFQSTGEHYLKWVGHG